MPAIKRFSALSIEKVMEADNFEKGCLGKAISCLFDSLDIDKDNLPSLLGAVACQYDLPDESDQWAIDNINCKNTGEYDLCFDREEDDNGEHVEVDGRLWEKFKAGKIDLWSARYTIRIRCEMVEPCQLSNTDKEGFRQE